MRDYRAREEWLARAAELRRHILICAGLYPEPPRCDLNPVIFGKVEHEDYTVEKVYFESLPGFLVTGNLYRPANTRGKRPAVLCPHGHSHQGRLEDNEAICSEPKRCIAFAKQGYVVFSYDMVGFNDSHQVSHQFAADDPVCALWGVNLMGLQLWNSIRSVDFLCSLPDVDQNRIGCTGASGGGTQTFLLMAVDDRIAVAAPVVMVSSHFQGGCLCENPPNLRINTFNVEIAALMAPRPLLLVGATGDWTKNTLVEEFPAIRKIYRLFDAEDKVAAKLFEAPHNYNQQSREAVYAWFARHLLGRRGKHAPKETPCLIDKLPNLLVFYGRKHAYPDVTEKVVVSNLIAESKQWLRSHLPNSPQSLERFRRITIPWLSDVLSIETCPAAYATSRHDDEQIIEGIEVRRFALTRQGEDWAIPVSLLKATGEKGGMAAALIVHPKGRSAVDGSQDGRINSLAKKLAASGYLVMTLDCYQTGEAMCERNKSTRFFTTYNRTDTSYQVQDIVDSLCYLKEQKGAAQICLVGFSEAGLWALLAGAVAPVAARTVVDMAKFAEEDESYVKRLFIPGLRKVGGIQTAAILHAPRALYLHNIGEKIPIDAVAQVYRKARSAHALLMRTSRSSCSEILEWVTKE